MPFHTYYAYRVIFRPTLPKDIEKRQLPIFLSNPRGGGGSNKYLIGKGLLYISNMILILAWRMKGHEIINAPPPNQF